LAAHLGVRVVRHERAGVAVLHDPLLRAELLAVGGVEHRGHVVLADAVRVPVGQRALDDVDAAVGAPARELVRAVEVETLLLRDLEELLARDREHAVERRHPRQQSGDRRGGDHGGEPAHARWRDRGAGQRAERGDGAKAAAGAERPEQQRAQQAADASAEQVARVHRVHAVRVDGQDQADGGAAEEERHGDAEVEHGELQELRHLRGREAEGERFRHRHRARELPRHAEAQHVQDRRAEDPGFGVLAPARLEQGQRRSRRADAEQAVADDQEAEVEGEA